MRDRLDMTVDQLPVFGRANGKSAVDASAGFQRAEQLRVAALIAADIVGFSLVFLAASIAADSGSYPIMGDAAAWVAVPIFAAVVAGLYGCGLYSRKAALAGEYSYLIRYSAYAFLFNLVLNLTLFDAPRRQFFLLIWLGMPLAMVIMRRVAAMLLHRTRIWSVPTVLIGTARGGNAARA